MMRTYLIYDSLYGNTKKVADVVAASLPGETKQVHIKDASPGEFQAFDLVLIGAPTHGAAPSDPVKELLDQIHPEDLKGLSISVFDTRLTWFFLRLFGYAAPKMARHLKQLGGKLIGEPGGFIVTGGEGPLKEGELDRAQSWAKSIARKVTEESEG